VPFPNGGFLPGQDYEPHTPPTPQHHVGAQPIVARVRDEGGEYARSVEGRECGDSCSPCDRAGRVSESCVAGSYFTQTRVVIDASLPRGARLNLNALAPGDPLRERFVPWMACCT